MIAESQNIFQAWWHWFEVHTGTVNESGPYYGFFSGFGSDLGEITILGALVVAYRHHECHNATCHKLGKHPTSDGFKLCHRCAGKPLTELTLPFIHEDHK